MPARDAVRTKSIEDASRQLELLAKIVKENDADAKLIATGARLLNRPGDRKKDAAIEAFMKADEKFDEPLAEDLLAEADVRWSHEFDRTKQTLRSVVEHEIEHAFQTAGLNVPVIANVHAQSLLRSEFRESELGNIHISEVSPQLVLAHIRALGFPWPDRVSRSVSRRVAVVLMNRHMWSEAWPTRPSGVEQDDPEDFH